MLVLENPDRFAIRLTGQISSIGLFAVTESQCTEDEHDDEDEDDSKFRHLDQLGGTGQILPWHVFGPTQRDRSNIAIARFLDMPRRIAQERVPTASNVGSRDVTSASQPTPLTPFRVFSRVSRAPFLRQSAKTNSEGQVKYCRCTFFGQPRQRRSASLCAMSGRAM